MPASSSNIFTRQSRSDGALVTVFRHIEQKGLSQLGPFLSARMTDLAPLPSAFAQGRQPCGNAVAFPVSRCASPLMHLSDRISHQSLMWFSAISKLGGLLCTRS